MENFRIVTNDNKTLNIITHSLNKNLKISAIIIHVHGFLQDFNYDETYLYLLENRIKLLYNLNVINYGLELRCHGKSSKGNICRVTIDDYSNDLKTLIKYIETTKYSKLPIHIIGTSLAGAIIINYCIKYNPTNIKSIILSSPLIDLCSWFKTIYYLNMLKSIIIPKNKVNDIFILCVRVKLHFNKYGSILNKYDNNDLYYLINNSISTLKIINNNKDKFKIPILAFHADNDKYTCSNATKNFIDTCGSTDKKVIIFENNTNHHLFKDTNILNTISENIYDWIKKHI